VPKKRSAWREKRVRGKSNVNQISNPHRKGEGSQQYNQNSAR